MRAYSLPAFGLENLKLTDMPAPIVGAGQFAIDLRAISLNYRDLLVIRGHYNPRFKLPAIPISDGAGVVAEVGPGVSDVRVGDHVLGNFVSDWLSGPFMAEHRGSTLGLPGPGMAAERVVLPAHAAVKIPVGYDFAQAATLPIAALTAWSALVTEGRLDPARRDNPATVLTLGTGGVSIFALQLAKALGARVIITSSDDAKLERARRLGADATINYRSHPDWDAQVLELTGGVGVDVTVETGGGGTLERSLKATRCGGVVSLLGALTGMKAEITTGMILMKRLRIAGIMVDSRTALEDMLRFIEKHAIMPVIERSFPFEQLPDALQLMESGGHFGKIVIEF